MRSTYVLIMYRLSLVVSSMYVIRQSRIRDCKPAADKMGLAAGIQGISDK